MENLFKLFMTRTEKEELTSILVEYISDYQTKAIANLEITSSEIELYRRADMIKDRLIDLKN
jgi:hypothetical protein